MYLFNFFKFLKTTLKYLYVYKYFFNFENKFD